MTDVAAAVREIIAKHASTSAFDDDTRLGGDGLGLDSIAVAEVLIDCEQRFGIEVADLLGGDPVRR
jgi:acyl carrier protein